MNKRDFTLKMFQMLHNAPCVEVQDAIEWLIKYREQVPREEDDERK
jgi:hypothetical protein